MPPKHHHGHRGRRFGRGGGVTYVVGAPYEDTVLFDCVRDIDGLCVVPTRAEQAGDIWPTFVSPEDAKRYIDQTDGGYQSLDNAIMGPSAAPEEFQTSWTIQLKNWQTFAKDAKASVGWLNTNAVMQQTDRYAAELQNWSKAFSAVGGKPPTIPTPIPPGQGIPDPNPTKVSDFTTLAIALAGLTALLVFGPKVARAL